MNNFNKKPENVLPVKTKLEARKQKEIEEIVAGTEYWNFEGFRAAKNDAIRKGILTIEEINNSPAVKEAVLKDLKRYLNKNNIDSFIIGRDAYANVGVISDAESNSILSPEEASQLTKERIAEVRKAYRESPGAFKDYFRD